MYTLTDIHALKGHTYLAWNIRSLLPKIEEIDRISLLGNPELIGICEIWLNDNVDTCQIDISGYNNYRFDRTGESGKLKGGGLIIYYKSQLKVYPQVTLEKCTPDVEMIWVRLELTRTRPIFYGLIYRPPNGNLDNFMNELETTIFQIRSWGPCEINIAGDINVDLLSNNNKSRQYRDGIRRLGMTNMISDSTHIKHMNYGFSLLDHYLTTDPNLHGTTGVLVTNVSDHFCIFAARKKTKNRT